MDDLLGRADALRARSRYGEALRLLKRALKNARARHRLECLISLGHTHRMRGEFALAGNRYEEAARQARRIREPVLAADAAVGMALSIRALGQWKEALVLLGKAAEEYKKGRDREGIAFVLWATAGTLRVKGDVPGALRAFDAARKRFSSLGDEPGVGYSLCGLGGASRVRGMFAESLGYYSEANVLFREIGDAFGKAYSHCGMGNALRMTGDYQGARTHFLRAIAIYRRIGDVVSHAYTLWSMGNSYLMLGRPALSKRYFKAAEAFFRKTGDPRGLIYTKLGLAQLRHLAAGKSHSRKILFSARDAARRLGFAVEECHAKALLAATEGARERVCYRKLGLRLGFDSIPFNIP